MKLYFSECGRKEFLSLDKQLQLFFKKHLEKLMRVPPRRHLRFGVPFHVENVTKQARLVYEVEGEALTILHCFAIHKDYEKWFKSFK